MDRIKIVLTEQAPVRINPKNWDIIASADDCWFDGEFEFDSERESEWDILVRRHRKGRVIVNAIYKHKRSELADYDIVIADGFVVEPVAAYEVESAEVIAAIRKVADTIATGMHWENDAERWPKLARDCIANLPPVDLD